MTEERLPAHDLDSERSLVATLATDPGCIPEVAAIVRPEEFYRSEHREIVAACYALEADGHYVEPASILAWLGDAKRLPSAGGSDYVARLLERTTTTQAPDQHARRIAVLAAVRAVDAQCSRLAAEARGPLSDPRSWLAEAPELIRAATDTALRSTTETLRGIRDVAASIVTALSATATDDGRERRIGTGLDGLDEQIGKLARKSVHIIAARPGEGKTALAHQVCIRAARRGVRCLYCSLEMAAEDLLSRAVAQIASVDHSLLERRRIDEMHTAWADVTRALDEVSSLPIVYEDAAVQSVAAIRGSARRAAKILGGPVDLVVIDYVQLVKTSARKGATRTELVGENSHAILAMAKDLECAVIEVSQLNRPTKGSKPGPPRLDDLRECGDLEQDARAVIGVYRPDRSSPCGNAELHVLKCRQGGREGVVTVAWSGPTMSFADIPGYRDDQYEPTGRSGPWSPPRDKPVPQHFNESAEREPEDYGDFAQDGLGGL